MAFETSPLNLTPGSASPVLSVSALNQAVAQLLERSFPLAWISGEVSNFTRAASGHWYFTLKDDAAQVRAVMFRGRASYADFLPREGDKVEVRATVSLYAARGDFQLGVEAIRRAGVGNLYEAFLQLKVRLEEEGLFNSLSKQPIPVFARRIGVITSPHAAALQDILSTLQRRAPHCEIVIYPTPVQGIGAGEKIAAMIATAAKRNECELLLLCRGGGSIEDLWAFNQEAVARAIAACGLPIISGIGHETDFTIADFAADCRAPTPTAAAEMAARPTLEWQTRIAAIDEVLARAFNREHAGRCQTLDWMTHRLVNPRTRIKQAQRDLQGWQRQLSNANHRSLTTARYSLTQLSTRMAARFSNTTSQRLQLSMQAQRLSTQMKGSIRHQQRSFSALATQLALLNPQRTLERGYAIVTALDGAVIRSPLALHAGQYVDIRLAEGSVQTGITTVQTITMTPSKA